MRPLLKKQYTSPYISEVKLDSSISLICESGEENPPYYPTRNFIIQENREDKTPFREKIFEEDTFLKWEK